MQRFLIFLLFISYSSSEYCKGGKRIRGICLCPKGSRLIKDDCVNIQNIITNQTRPCPFGYIRTPDGKCKRRNGPIVSKEASYIFISRGINGYFSSIKYKRKQIYYSLS